MRRCASIVSSTSPPGLRTSGVQAGVVVARGPDDARQQGPFRERELAHGLAEVRLARGADPVRAVAEVDDREVAVEDLVLGCLAVELAGEDRLSHLSGDRALLPRVGVLDVLLGDRRAPLDGLSPDVGPHGAQRALRVDAAVGVEALVLDGDDGVLEDLGDVFLLHGDGGLVLAEDGDLVAVDVIDVAHARGHAGLRLRQGGGQRQEEEGPEHRRDRAEGHQHAAGDEDHEGADRTTHVCAQFTTSSAVTYLHPHLAGHKADGVGGHGQAARAYPGAVLQAVAPLVPRACDAAVLHDPLGEGAADVQAGVVQRIDAAVHTEQRDLPAAGIGDAGPRVGEVVETEEGVLGHGPVPYCLSVRPPSVDALAGELAGVGLPHPLLVDAAREAIAAGDPSSARARAERMALDLLSPVINATGVLLHTNLGRAPLAHTQTASYTNLELDLGTGRRGSRHRHAATLLARAAGAEAALVVNNGAAAVLLALAALAAGRGVVVSAASWSRSAAGSASPT